MQFCHDDHIHITFILTIRHIMLINEKYTDTTTFSKVYFWIVRDRQKILPVFRIKHDKLTVRTLYRQTWQVRTAIYFVIFSKPAISFAGLPQKKQDILPVFPVMKSARKTGKKPEKCVLRPERPDHLVCFPGFGNEPWWSAQQPTFTHDGAIFMTSFSDEKCCSGLWSSVYVARLVAGGLIIVWKGGHKRVSTFDNYEQLECLCDGSFQPTHS